MRGDWDPTMFIRNDKRNSGVAGAEVPKAFSIHVYHPEAQNALNWLEATTPIGKTYFNIEMYERMSAIMKDTRNEFEWFPRPQAGPAFGAGTSEQWRLQRKLPAYQRGMGRGGDRHRVSEATPRVGGARDILISS